MMTFSLCPLQSNCDISALSCFLKTSLGCGYELGTQSGSQICATSSPLLAWARKRKVCSPLWACSLHYQGAKAASGHVYTHAVAQWRGWMKLSALRYKDSQIQKQIHSQLNFERLLKSNIPRLETNQRLEPAFSPTGDDGNPTTCLSARLKFTTDAI